MYFSVTNSEAKKIHAEGRCEHSPSVSVRYCTNNEYRFSAVVSKKQGIATERNRVKRIIRELMRCKKDIYPPGLYLVYFNGLCKDINRTRLERDLDDIMKKVSQKRML